MFITDELNLALERSTLNFNTAARQLKINRAKFSPGQININFFSLLLTAKIDIGKTDSRDSMISYVYYIGQYFVLRICLFYENNNLKMQFFCTSHKGFRSLKSNC